MLPIRVGPVTWLASAFAALLVTALGVPDDLAGQAGRPEVDEGNELYAEGRFAEAYERYLEALRESPGSPLIHFNQGAALYQAEDYERALEAFQEAISGEDPALTAGAWYNLGNTLYRSQQLEASLEAFKQALRANPSDVDAKHNLERVLEELQQQEQQEDPQESQGEEGEPPPEGEEEEDPDQDQQNPPEEPPPPEEEQDQEDPESPPPDAGDDQGQSPPPPPGMSREEAERLLQAVQEDPDEVNRKPPEAAVGRLPRKVW